MPSTLAELEANVFAAESELRAAKRAKAEADNRFQNCEHTLGWHKQQMKNHIARLTEKTDAQ